MPHNYVFQGLQKCENSIFFANCFIDSFIQKTKQRYNNTRTLTSRLNLSEMSEDLHNNPPFQILQTELGPENNADIKTYKTGGECLYTVLLPFKFVFG